MKSLRLEARLTRWGVQGGILLAGMGALLAVLLATAWAGESRALSAAAEQYAREESETLARLLLYDLSGDARVRACRFYEQRLGELRKLGYGTAPASEPSPALIEFVRSNLRLPDAVLWDGALRNNIPADLKAITAARFHLYSDALELDRTALAEELSARVTVSDHLRGVELRVRSGSLAVTAGDTQKREGRAFATFPLVVEGEPWADVTVLVDPGYLEDVRKGLNRSLAQFAGVLAGGLLAAMAAWGFLWWRMLKNLRRTVVEPVTELAAKMEAFEHGAISTDTGGDEAARLAVAFDLLVARVAASREQLRQAQEERQGTSRALARLMAHELHNPLTPMRLWLQEIQALPEDGPAKMDTLREAVPVLLDQVERMGRLVKRFRDLAEDRPLEASPLSIAEAASAAVGVLRAQAERAGVSLQVEIPSDLVALADDTALYHLLLNLLRNAVEAQEGKGGTVTLRGRGESQLVVVEVEDSGGGLPAEVAAAPFTPYLTTKAGGTGLGLVVCRELANRMGGTLELDNHPGIGLTARITLPKG